MKKILVLIIILIFIVLSCAMALNNSFVGSVAVYDATGELYMLHAGVIENLSYGDSGVRFTFEGNDYTYINYFIEVIR